MILEEGDLRFDFSQAIAARRFDGPGRGLSDCDMKSVDFIVETENKILFIEVKDYQHPKAPEERRRMDAQKAKSYPLIKEELAPKCRDTYLHQLATGQLGKPVTFIAVIALDSLLPEDMSAQRPHLMNCIAARGKLDPAAAKPFVQCLIFNLATWNRHLSQFPLSRISQQA